MFPNVYEVAKNILDPTNAHFFTGRTDEFYYSLLQVSKPHR